MSENSVNSEHPETSNSSESCEQLDEEDDAFYFESDHLALKGNKDYRDLLKTIVTLEAQRTQAIKDLDELKKARAKALEDPIAFVARLQNGDLPEFPGRQKLAEIPDIDWTKYNIGESEDKAKPKTRNSNLPQTQTKNDEDDSVIKVRGRPFDESKPETFNQLWTNEEQKRLEELLIEYPAEEVEMRRWTKIANALGNRTPKQVSSRVQKYFMKLSRAGLPVPGRGPKVKTDLKKPIHRHQKHNRLLFRRSTFFPHEEISMDEEIPMENIYSKNPLESNDENSSRFSECFDGMKIEKINEDNQSTYHHLGYKCYICGEEPVKGIRYHCNECPENVDLCEDCTIAQSQAEDPIHCPSHRMTEIRPPNYDKNYDADYLPQNFNSTSYNYLDPNFLPE